MWRATLSLLNLSAARQVIRAHFRIGSSYSDICSWGGRVVLKTFFRYFDFKVRDAGAKLGKRKKNRPAGGKRPKMSLEDY